LRGPCREERHRILSVESGTVLKDGSFPLEVALVYPNNYAVGGSSLGLQYVYHLFNSFEDVRCERVYWDHKLLEPATGQPISVEGGRKLSSFSMLAYTVSFEEDYDNMIRVLLAGGVSPERGQRLDDEPLIPVGGPCAFMNPEPLAPLVDLFAVGDGEQLIPMIIRKWREVVTDGGGRKSDYIDAIAGEDGFYAPQKMEVERHSGGEIKSFTYLGKKDTRIRKVWSDRYGNGLQRILSPLAHFATMPLVEVGAGCARGCRFCAASFTNRPPRKRSSDEINRDIDRFLPMGDGRIGLIGSALSDHPELVQILEYIEGLGGKAGLSSMRLDGMGENLIEVMTRVGVKTITCAPEAGSQRMRDVIRKSLNEEEILDSIERIGKNGLNVLKLYFMVGLPMETEKDVESIIALVRRGRSVLRSISSRTRISVKINPFVPKPFTPFQWAPMDDEVSLKRKIDYLRKKLAAERGISLKTGSVRKSIEQAILSRGDRRLASCMIAAARQNASLRASMRKIGLDSHFYLFRRRPAEEVFPWDFIDHGVQKKWLYKEYQRGYAAASGWSADSA